MNLLQPFRASLTGVIGFVLIGALGAQADTLGTTTVDLNTGTVDALVGLGITPGAVSPGTLTSTAPFVATFPIIGIDPSGMMISHSGGLSFTEGNTMAEIENFVINLNNYTITGQLYAGSTLLNGNLTLFDIGSGDSLTLDQAFANAINTTFGTSLSGGLAIGTASVSIASAPEPATFGMFGAAGILGLGLLRRRRKA